MDGFRGENPKATMRELKELTSSRRWLTVVVFATAMAWVESAVVYDLRTMVNRIEPYQDERGRQRIHVKWVKPQ